MRIKRSFVVFVALFMMDICSGGNLFAQRWQININKGGKVDSLTTFELPPLYPIPTSFAGNKAAWEEERERVRKKLLEDKKKFEVSCLKILKKVKRYFEQLTQPKEIKNQAYTDKKEAAIADRLNKILGNVRYSGIYIDRNFRERTKQTSVEKYIEFMRAYSKTQNGLASVCWNINLKDTVDLAFQKSVAKAGYIFNTPPKQPNDRLTYQIYKGIGYIKEEIAFFKDNVVKNIPVCKELVFSLRYLEIIDKNGKQDFEWQVHVEAFKSQRSKDCGKIKRIECELPPPPDSGFVMEYIPVEPWKYLVPGYGFYNSFKENSKPTAPYIITPIVVSGVAAGIYFKIKSDDFYSKHKSATTFRVLDENYKDANQKNHQFIISTGIGLGVWLVTDAIIFFKDRRQNSIFKKRFIGKGKNTQNSVTRNNTPQHTILPTVVNYSNGPPTLGVYYNIKF